VASTRGWYNPLWHYENEPETRLALDLISANHFSQKEPGIFSPILDTLLAHGDYYLHLADLKFLPRGRSTFGHPVRRTQIVGQQGDFERSRFGQIFQRPHYCPVRNRNLGRATVPGIIRCASNCLTRKEHYGIINW